MGVVNISKESSGRLTVTFPYALRLVEKVKTTDGRKWHKDKRYWSFPDSNVTLEKILEVFKGEEIYVSSELQTQRLEPVITSTQPLSLRGTKSCGNLNTDSEESPHNFDTLKR